MNPSYSIKAGKHGIYLIDNNVGTSITNMAERVVSDVCRQRGGDLPIYYRDSEGQWDELKHAGGEFVDFSFGVNNEWAENEMISLGLS